MHGNIGGTRPATPDKRIRCLASQRGLKAPWCPWHTAISILLYSPWIVFLTASWRQLPLPRLAGSRYPFHQWRSDVALIATSAREGVRHCSIP